MGLLDAMAGQAFRDDKAGRVVVFTGDRRNRGYVVRSEADELKIKSFLKMFYLAQFSILLLGTMVANAWSIFVINLHEMGRPARHLVRSEAIFLGIYFLVVGVPYFLLWRSYKKGLSTFVSDQDQVAVTNRPASLRRVFIALGVMIIALAVLLAVLCLIRFK